MGFDFSKLSWLKKFIINKYSSIINFEGFIIIIADNGSYYEDPYCINITKLSKDKQDQIMNSNWSGTIEFEKDSLEERRYYILFEDGNGSHLPYPIAPFWMKWIANRYIKNSPSVKKFRTRGKDFFFTCRECGKQSFYSYKGAPCNNCIDKVSLEVTEYYDTDFEYSDRGING